MSDDHAILEQTGRIAKYGDALEHLGDGAYRFYVWERNHDPGGIPLDIWNVWWVDFGMDDDLLERFEDGLQDIADTSTDYDVRDMAVDAASDEPRDRARFLRQYVDHHGYRGALGEPQRVDHTWFDFIRARPVAPTRDVSRELAEINAHRRSLGMRPLDPASAGWSDDDVVTEAQRLRRNPFVCDARDALLAW